MKFNKAIAAFLLSISVFSWSCDNEDEIIEDPVVVLPTEEEIFLEKLAGEWTVHEVTVDDKDVTSAFDGLKIRFHEDKRYAVTKPQAGLWPASGTFSLKKESQLYTIVRDDDVEANVEALEDHEVTLSFTYTTSGRTRNVSGEFVFVLNR